MIALASNDDGIWSEGLRVMVEALARAGMEVVVAAPCRDMSGLGKSIRFPVRLEPASFPGAAHALAGEGPPASIVYAAIRLLRHQGVEPSLVASGVNHGPNLGAEDLLTSATIGAALEAAFQGVPAIAVSTWSRASRLTGEERAIALEVVRRAAPIVAGSGAGAVISINIPRAPIGAAAVRPAFNRYDVDVVVRGGEVHPLMSEDRIYSNHDPPPGTDLWAYRRRLITVVPIGVDPPLCPGEREWRLAEEVARSLESIPGVRRGS